MSFVLSTQQEWNEGEKRMHKLRHSNRHENPTSSFLLPSAAIMLQTAPLLALGTLDSEGRPWGTLWGGESGFAKPLGQNIVGIRTIIDPLNDPVIEALYKGQRDVETVGAHRSGKMVSGLTIDMENRKRAKLYGTMVAGALVMNEEQTDQESMEGARGEAQLVLRIEQSLGNCPKYITSRHIVPNVPKPKLLSDSPTLTPEALTIISTADTLFIASANATHDMDCNIRGGPPGFIRVLPQSTYSPAQPTTLVWPEYSGNQLYQTLGNLTLYPKAGLVIPSFATSSVLYLSGNTQNLHGSDASSILPHTNLAVQLTITSARLVANGLPFRSSDSPTDLSPYNPPVRYLASEKPPAETLATPTTATLISSTRITPTITHHKFSLSQPQSWLPGQHIALSFANDLDMGYSHMRDDDPRSLNDDFIRTFTISSAAPTAPSPKRTKFDILIRQVGPVTAHLAACAKPSNQRKPNIEVEVKGFGGEFNIAQKEEHGPVATFIAAGVGITPLLSQLHTLDLERLLLFWSVAAPDVALVVHVLRDHPGLGPRLKLFVTGVKVGDESSYEVLKDGLKGMGVTGVQRRRMREEDLKREIMEGTGKAEEEWYVCTGPGMRKEGAL